MHTNKKRFSSFIILLLATLTVFSQHKPVRNYSDLHQLQQAFVDLNFGMFIHYNIPTYMDDDWADPDADPSIFNPAKLDCGQWAKAARSANMTYGCLTTKHHSGFAIWDTKTTDYNVMKSPLKRDVVREFVDAFRAADLKVMLYYSILDTHHKIRPNRITPEHIKMIKAQLKELLTNYGAIDALVIDGWDAPWSRISYEEVPFEEIYLLVKSLQPNCLVMDLNAAKYPTQALYYTDIKSYEQNAGQHISTGGNGLPALSCLPLQQSWFWKTSFPTTAVKDPVGIVNDDIRPFNKAYCNFILNVAPNRDGLIDENALTALKQIGASWENEGPGKVLPLSDAPIISPNIAKFKPASSSWSDDMNIMDFANDDKFNTAWRSNSRVKNPWLEIDLKKNADFNMIVIADKIPSTFTKYKLQYHVNGQWKNIFSGENGNPVKIHRFNRLSSDKVRIQIKGDGPQPEIAEFGVFNEPAKGDQQ